jgi:hypothetical protein
VYDPKRARWRARRGTPIEELCPNTFRNQPQILGFPTPIGDPFWWLPLRAPLGAHPPTDKEHDSASLKCQSAHTPERPLGVVFFAIATARYWRSVSFTIETGISMCCREDFSINMGSIAHGIRRGHLSCAVRHIDCLVPEEGQSRHEPATRALPRLGFDLFKEGAVGTF